MPSKQFHAFMKSRPMGPLASDGPIFIHPELHVPCLPEGYVPPEPEIPDGFTGGKVVAGGVPGIHLTMPGLREKACFLHIHGGGYTVGCANNGLPVMALFARELGLEGYSVDYRLAPWHKHPAAITDCLSFYKGLLAMGYETIVVGGESAGAQLTLSLAMAVRDAGLTPPAVIWCSSPPDDIQYHKRELYHKDLFLQTSDGIIQGYAGDADLTDPMLSPIYGDFAGLPPMVLQAGGNESLNAGVVRLMVKAAQANQEVLFHFGKDMPHTYAMDFASYPEAQMAMEEILTFVLKRLDWF